MSWQGLGFRLVDEIVARNPVARAIAMSELTLATRDFSSRLYMLTEGEEVSADVFAASKVVMVALTILGFRQQGESPAARVMRGGISCMADLARRGFRWRPGDAVAIDQALQHALPVYRGATAIETQRAHKIVAEADAQAASAEQAAQNESGAPGVVTRPSQP